MTSTKKIAFLHKNIVFGGAERLILDIGLSLTKEGHECTYFTTEYSTKKTFEEFSNTEGIKVELQGKFIPNLILGRFRALLNVVKMMYLTFYLIFFTKGFDLVIVDQITFPIPFLRLCNKKVLYYCHFPEKLLNDNKPNPLVKIYRFLFDNLEAGCIFFSSAIFYNSDFTKRMTDREFSFLKRKSSSQFVLHPCVHLKDLQSRGSANERLRGAQLHKYFLSLNRFETRKNFSLAIAAFQNFELREQVEKQDLKLVIAGALDQNNIDSKNCYKNLQNQVEPEMKSRIIFFTNLSFEEKNYLLR